VFEGALERVENGVHGPGERDGAVDARTGIDVREPEAQAFGFPALRRPDRRAVWRELVEQVDDRLGGRQVGTPGGGPRP
jgi:hypothetical protein